jgi:hypothetical protein
VISKNLDTGYNVFDHFCFEPRKGVVHIWYGLVQLRSRHRGNRGRVRGLSIVIAMLWQMAALLYQITV